MRGSAERNDHALDRTRKVFSWVSHAANAGEACPTNAEMALRFGALSTATVARAMSFLETAGMISIERGNSSRVVTICASGKSTAGKTESSRLVDLDSFAELLADGADVPEASRLMNWSTRTGHKALGAIRRGLGSQAA